MNRCSIYKFVSFAGMLSAAAGCDSSTPRRNVSSSEETCARLTACGLLPGFSGSSLAGFGECEFYTGIVGTIGDPAGSDQKLDAAIHQCMVTASSCDEIRACVRPTPDQATVCATTTEDTCRDAVMVNCGDKGTSQGVTAYSCAQAGLVCGAGTLGRAMCGIAACDPKNTPPVCDGDLLVTCEESGNVLNSHDCRLEQRTCGTKSTGGAACVGTTPCDAITFEFRCDGPVMISCDGDTEVRSDCGRFGPGLTCSEQHGGGGYSSVSCVPIDRACSLEDLESCQNGRITYCKSGRPATFDCRSLGFSGCATQAAGTRTIAGCVL